MKEWIVNNKLTVIGVILGALAGFLYWRFVGCASGQCIITSRPLNSSLYGAVMGGLLLSMFQRSKPRTSGTNKK